MSRVTARTVLSIVRCAGPIQSSSDVDTDDTEPDVLCRHNVFSASGCSQNRSLIPTFLPVFLSSLSDGNRKKLGIKVPQEMGMKEWRSFKRIMVSENYCAPYYGEGLCLIHPMVSTHSRNHPKNCCPDSKFSPNFVFVCELLGQCMTSLVC